MRVRSRAWTIQATCLLMLGDPQRISGITAGSGVKQLVLAFVLAQAYQQVIDSAKVIGQYG